MDDNQIRHMVNRFLNWRIPQDFSPDHNIHFEGHTEHGPVGTNLFTATQAEGMIRHMLAGLPQPSESRPVDMDDLLNRPVKDYTQPALQAHNERSLFSDADNKRRSYPNDPAQDGLTHAQNDPQSAPAK